MVSVDKDLPADREGGADGGHQLLPRLDRGAAQRGRVPGRPGGAGAGILCLAGLSLIDTVRDEGVSAAGPLATRPGGAALLRALARHQAQHVVVVTLDRAFRSTLGCLSTVPAWDRAGVSLHLVDHGGQSIATATAVGRMFLTMLAGFTASGLRGDGEAPDRRAHRERDAAQESAPPGVSPDALWLRPCGRGLAAESPEQAVIRQVQDWQRAGQSLHWIAGELARRQVPTKRGGRWYAGTVWYLLRNALYAEEGA